MWAVGAIIGADPLGQLTMPTGGGALALLTLVLVFVGKSIHDAARRSADERAHLVEQRDHAEALAHDARLEAEEQRAIATELRTELIQVALAAELGRPIVLDDLVTRLRAIDREDDPPT